MSSVVSLRTRTSEGGATGGEDATGQRGVVVPLPARPKPWSTDCCCALVDTAGAHELHASARWFIELFPATRERDYPEFEITVYHRGWAQALTLQAFGPPRDAEQRSNREYAARLLHQMLSASYQARP